MAGRRNREHAVAGAIGRRLHPPPPTTRGGGAVLARSASRPRGREPRPDDRRVQERPAAVRDAAPRRGGPSGSATTSSTTPRRRRSSWTSRRTTRRSARRSPAFAASSRRTDDAAVATRLTVDSFRQLIESRDAQFGALAGVRVRRRRHRARSRCAIDAPEDRVRVGIVCYASVGGSGVVATELAHALALRGHQVAAHEQRGAVPMARRAAGPVVPACGHAAHIRCSASRSTCSRWPTRSSASRAIASSTSSTRTTRCRTRPRRIWPIRFWGSTPGTRRPRTVTTLHGTDITLVGSDPSYARVVAFSIEQSHGVTAVSESLKRETIDTLGIAHDDRSDSQFSRLHQLPPPAAARASRATSRRAASRS